MKCGYTRIVVAFFDAHLRENGACVLRVRRPLISDLYCNYDVKLPFVASVLGIVFTIKAWCQFHPHSSYQSFNQNCTTFTKGLILVV